MRPPPNVSGAGLASWHDGIACEVDFWTRWFETGGLDWPNDYARRLDPNAELDPLIESELSGVIGRPPRILDVGCGPITRLGYRSRAHRAIEIVACDPLAEVYADIRRRFSIVAPVETMPAYAEDLMSVFGASSFDLVNCQNALDHACDPVQGLLQMLRVVRVGGVVLLRHRRNEAEFECYSGFHQFNFDLERKSAFGWKKDFIVWNKAIRINASRAIPIKCDITHKIVGDRLHSRFVKRKEFG